MVVLDRPLPKNLDFDLDRGLLPLDGSSSSSSLYFGLWILNDDALADSETSYLSHMETYQLLPTMLMPLASAWR